MRPPTAIERPKNDSAIRMVNGLSASSADICPSCGVFLVPVVKRNTRSSPFSPVSVPLITTCRLVPGAISPSSQIQARSGAGVAVANVNPKGKSACNSTSLTGAGAFDEIVTVNSTGCPDTVSTFPSIETESADVLKVAAYSDDATKMALEPSRRYSSSTFTFAVELPPPANTAETVPCRRPPGSIVPKDIRWLERSVERSTGARVPQGDEMNRYASRGETR